METDLRKAAIELLQSAISGDAVTDKQVQVSLNVLRIPKKDLMNVPDGVARSL